MRFRLWAQIGATLLVNLILLSTLAALLVMQQTRSGLDSFLYAPARERVREIGRAVEEEFPALPERDRDAWLRKLQTRSGLTLAVYDDAGRQVAGDEARMPAAFRQELRGDRDEQPRRPKGPPLFFIPDGERQRFWFGYNFPVVIHPGSPPARHTLAVIAPSRFGVPLLFDWWPWLGTAALALVITLACWLPLVRRITGSIHAVTHAANEIAKGRFDVPLPVTGADELAKLTRSIRRMAEQLAHLINGQQRFLADVAHELCAPLSRIQLSTGILEQRASPQDAKHVERLERDVAQMSALVGDLLSFTKGATKAVQLTPVALTALIHDAILQEGATDQPISVEVPTSIQVLADAASLQRAVANVLRNALRYAGHAGPIRVLAQPLGKQIHLSIVDSGPGLPDADLDTIFSPFYRPDTVRTPGAAGAGLGLAIVKSAVEVCGGSVFCRNRSAGGLEVVIELNLAPYAKGSHPAAAPSLSSKKSS